MMKDLENHLGAVEHLAAGVFLQVVRLRGRELVVDERLAGVAAGAVAIWLRAPLLAVMVVAAATAALIRLF